MKRFSTVRKSPAAFILAAAAIASAGLALTGASAQQLAPLTFTGAQASAGGRAFNDFCATCHGTDLLGAGGPALKGDGFATEWLSQPVGALYHFISLNMPYDNPGGLNATQYTNLVAFIAQQNGFVAGGPALPEDEAAMNGIGFRQ